MNPGGVVLILLAVWVSTQTLAGQALERLGVLDASGRAAGAAAAGSSAASTATTSRTTTEIGAMTSKYNTGPV